uniref:Lysyl oxidase homolog n=1 Tax=Serinus canaria TaxID=9135 RepID=A0A8C9U7J7_SERCA
FGIGGSSGPCLLLLLAGLSCAQYEHWPYLPGYPEPAPQLFQPAQRAPDVPKIQLRLAGQKRKHNEGRVEVFYSGEWGTVCDDDFSIHAAHVVCRELGYVEAVSWLPGSKYGKGEGKIWLDNVHCTGRESSLAGCGSNGWGVSDCKHTEDVGVLCSDKRIPGFKFDNSLINQIENMNIQVEDIRIRAILATYRKRVPVTEGYVEVKDEGTWKQICDKHWTMKNSRVVCGMFGFPSKPRGHPHSVCVLQQPLVRLKGGANTGEGRVEVLRNGEWGTVCDDNWNLVSASVVCRELGFGSAKEAITGARLGQGMGPIHLNEIDCTGFEKSVTDCKFNTESQGCNHEEDAAVRCNVPAMGFQNQLRLSGGRNPYEGRVEVLAERNGTLRWGTVCSHNWGTVEAMVVCRQLGLGFASHAFQVRNFIRNWNDGTRGNGFLLPEGRVGWNTGNKFSAPDLVLNAELVEQTAYLEDRPMFLLQCALEENCLASSAHNTSLASGYRRLLRFSSQIHNNGQSDFRPKNGRHAWVWHDCHRHYHSMEVFTHYDLLNLNGTKVAEGHKASFCLEDTECEADVQKQYECANFGEQGITVGCWDVYRHDIDCQWVDITDVPPGDYLFQVVINPNYEVAESDYSNNVMKCRSRYDGQRIWMYNCHIGGSFSEETEQKFDHPRALTNHLLSAR